MENLNNNNGNSTSYGKEFSSTPKQMEHQKAMAQENHEYQLKMQKAQHDHEISMRNMDLGKVGYIFGASDNSSRNIAASICFVLLVAIIAMSCVAYYMYEDKSFVASLWQLILPVITLSLGYIFGKPNFRNTII